MNKLELVTGNFVGSGKYVHINCDGKQVCDLKGEISPLRYESAMQHGERIVKCVNTHDELADALKKFIDIAKNMDELSEGGEVKGIYREIEQLSRLAKKVEEYLK